MTSRTFDPSDPFADAAACTCADLARWCDDLDPDVRRDGRALARADRHLAACATCRDRFGAELRFWAALAAPETATVSLTPTYRPPAHAIANDAGAANPRSFPSAQRLLRVALLSILGAVIVIYVLISNVRLIPGPPSVDAPTSRDAGDRAITSASPTATPTATPTPTPTSISTSPSEVVAPDGDPRFRRQFVTRAQAGASRGAASDLRPSALLVRAADARPAPVFTQSFSVEQRTPSSTSLLVLESAARTLAMRAP